MFPKSISIKRVFASKLLRFIYRCPHLFPSLNCNIFWGRKYLILVLILGECQRMKGGSQGEELNLENGKEAPYIAAPLSGEKRVVNKGGQKLSFSELYSPTTSVITTVLLEHFYPSKVKVPCNGSKSLVSSLGLHCPTSSILKEHRSSKHFYLILMSPNW